MRRSQGYSARRCIVNSDTDVAGLVVRAAAAARRKGLRVTPAEEVTAARLLRIYVGLAGGSVDVDEAAAVVASVFAKRPGEEADARAAFAEALCGRGDIAAAVLRAVEEDLRSLGLEFGRDLGRGGAGRRRIIRRDPRAYARLRLLGIIRRGRRGEYVVSKRAAEEIASEIARSYGGLREALAELVGREAGRRGPLLGFLGAEALDYLGEPGLREALAVYNASRGDADRGAAARAVAEALDRGERPGGLSEAEAVLNVLAKHGLLSPSRARALLEAEPRLAPRVAKLLGREAVLDIADAMARDGMLEEAAEVVARSLGLGGSAAAAAREALLTGAPLTRESVESLVGPASVVEYAARYLAGMGEGYLDMARALVERLPRGHSAAELVKALTTGETGQALRILAEKLPVQEAFNVLSNTYRGSSDPALRLYALMLLALLWRRVVAATGSAVARRRRLVEGPGSLGIDKRETLYNLLRLAPQPVRGLERGRARRLVLALDKSGSMRPHAFYALAASTALSPLIERLVVFDSAVSVFERRGLPRNPYQVARMLLETSFEGYTDVAAAVEAATRGLPPRRLVLVSDIKQTVAHRRGAVEAIADAASRGWRVTILAPRSGVDREAAVSLKKTRGVDVILVAGPADIARKLLRVASRL